MTRQRSTSATARLREHREAAQRLDGVAPELGAHRSAGRRIDVDDAAAHGELAALAHLLGALVAQAGEAGEHRVEGELGALEQSSGARLQGERDEALEQGDGVGDDDAVALLERASARCRWPSTCAAGATSAP